jgi:hypothetical protein
MQGKINPGPLTIAARAAAGRPGTGGHGPGKVKKEFFERSLAAKNRGQRPAARRKRMSPYQAVTDSPVLSVSVMTATPEIMGGSSPKALR